MTTFAEIGLFGVLASRTKAFGFHTVVLGVGVLHAVEQSHGVGVGAGVAALKIGGFDAGVGAVMSDILAPAVRRAAVE